MFILPDELARQLAARDEWRITCLNLGATLDQVADFERDAERYAQTTPYPNHEVIEAARDGAFYELMRGQPMPQGAKEVVQAELMRRLARAIGL